MLERESWLGSVSMHVTYGQPLPNPLLAAKKHHSMDIETTPTSLQLYGCGGSLSHTKKKSMISYFVENGGHTRED